jgi:hypothetical protein
VESFSSKLSLSFVLGVVRFHRCCFGGRLFFVVVVVVCSLSIVEGESVVVVVVSRRRCWRSCHLGGSSRFSEGGSEVR